MKIELDKNCWIAHHKNAISNLPSIMEYFPESLNLTQQKLRWYGKEIFLPRLTSWYGPVSYDYSGTKNPPKELSDDLISLIRIIEKKFFEEKKIFNSVLCNYYRDGKDSISWHSDDESILGPEENNILIASLSFGNSRRFVLRNRENRIDKKEFLLEHGDIFLMGGETQKYWEHSIPKTSKKVGPRLNLTFRSIKKELL